MYVCLASVLFAKYGDGTGRPAFHMTCFGGDGECP